ncbi:RNA polymerase sigma-70 factor (ECF subfamily) [Bosea sp. BE125]|uniref:sigma-70 family RNA polymerase sigma factor n=1 Tax=Bosea sp. BE125 TaxID=2817909 RepID=UPI0028614357|nr:sigma-70 family RNA polymerase sigma factor [Bosea sp. BE125]MDR6872683.1 RNA polymerase sigma-70 factor (ECF subfamily) [Bosea sp. BE125]
MPIPSRFEQLALPHQEAAFSLAFWLLSSRADAEDVVQEAFLRAFRAFDGFRGEDIRPWLFAIVRNAAYRTLNNRQRTANVISLDAAFHGREGDTGAPLDIAAEGPSAEDALIGKAERDLVRLALAELPTAFREVVVLREIEGLSYREISEITDTAVGTVMSRLSRGRLLLRRALARKTGKDCSHAL